MSKLVNYLLANTLIFELFLIGKARYNVWSTTATSFILMAGVEDTEYLNFIDRFKELSKQNFSKETLAPKHCIENIWLLKPANMNQGNFLLILSNFLY